MKSMSRPATTTLIPLSARLLQTSAIVLSKNHTIGAGITKVTLTTSKDLSQKPSLSYSLDGENYDVIPLVGAKSEWTGYIFIAYDSNEAVGSFKFRGVDMNGDVGDEITSGGIFLVDTLKPSAIDEISIFGVSKGIKIEWYFDEEYEHFNIYRSTLPNVDRSNRYKSTDE